MKILVVHNFYKTDNIGGEDLVFRNEVLLLKKYLGDENVFTYTLSNDRIRSFKIILTIWFSFSVFLEVRKLIKRQKIDILHVHNYFPLITPSIFLAARSLKVRTINTLHNFRPWCIAGTFYRDSVGTCELCKGKVLPFSGIKYSCYRKSLIQSFIAQLAFSFYKLTGQLNMIDYFFVLTPFQKEKLISLNVSSRKILLKPNAVEMKDVQSQDKNGYLFVGRFEEGKGLRLLLEVWKDLPSNFKLTVVGGGEDFEEFASKYEATNVVFKNFLSRAETLKEISKAKYLIHPSLYYETFGLTIVEALGTGTPVIGLNIGTRKDFIKDGYNGFLCEIKNLRETIFNSYYVSNYAELSSNALFSSKNFDAEVVIEKQVELYRNIIEKG